MKGLIHAQKEGFAGLTYSEVETPSIGENEVRVQLKAAGMNHRDLFVLKRHKPTDPPLVIGSDGAGVVSEAGSRVSHVQVGDEVIINPGLGWKENSDAPPEGFEIVGLPFHGTFAESIVLPADNVAPKPSFLSWEEAGVLSLAGLTAYRALFTRGKVKSGMKVLIPGIGSGVATFLLQFAKAAGADVYVTSRAEEKRAAALDLGAVKAIDSNLENWEEELDVKMDLVIECVGAATFQKSLNQLRTGGTIVTFGASAGDEVKLNLREFFYGQFNMLGSTMGSAEEHASMLQFIEQHSIKPVLDEVYTFDQFEKAFTRLERGEQLGKIGFKIE
ncbi:zinc-binding dehydrogenase [Jeotgalibacillus sp. ET6]|uniref:zinc-binding dehydrogenase n=1 Tax=Jeotgalibacillus sp. ET6 TaxID=3037260 RepID=UPI002418ADD4|nr:zinc-binding dehydrogenase [Jeotgalibacillus sp. ET6]MDG5472569.1 zinc-binding dehydrogenase [Jeotgalibacillus sp. ET6]